jgi:NAD(P)H-dependent FMN reductase
MVCVSNHDSASMRILAISGSLRAASLNSLLLRAVARLAPGNIAVDVYNGLARIPLFNPDLERDPPGPVVDLRSRIIESAAVLIASPEYAHGVSGPMKNALDWMVGNESFVHKPVAVLSTSPRATIARAALLEILATMSASIAHDACITIPLLGSMLTEDWVVADPEIAQNLRAALWALQCFSRSVRSEI